MSYGLLAAAAAASLLLAAAERSWASAVVLLVPPFLPRVIVRLGRWDEPIGSTSMKRALTGFGVVAAASFLGLLILVPTTWLPLRVVTATREPIIANGQPLPQRFAAYLVSRDSNKVTLLLDSPRVVLEVGASAVGSSMPLCSPPEAPFHLLYVSASQVLRIDADPHTPYQICPALMPSRYDRHVGLGVPKPHGRST